MRKLLKFTFAALALLCLAASCDANPGTTTMRLVLKTAADNAKTIYPQNSYDVAEYVVNGTYTGSANVSRNRFTVTTSSPSVAIEGLAVGTWHVEVTARNSRGDAIITGADDISLSGKSGSHTIVLDTLVGTGSVNVTVKWASGTLTDPRLHISMRSMDDGGESQSKDSLITPDYANNRAIYSESGLPAGSYLMTISLYEGEESVAGMVEAIRVSANDTSSGTLSFDYRSDYSQYVGSLFLVTATGVPIEGEIVPTKDNMVFADEDVGIEFKLKSNLEQGTDYSIEWYLDGVKVGETATLGLAGNGVTINTRPGSHVLTALVYSSKYGSTGTASWFFTSVLRGKVGAIALAATVPGSYGGLKVCENSLVGAIANGRLVFVNTSNSNIQLCSITSGNGLKLEDSYSSTDFNWSAAVSDVYSDPNFNIFAMTYWKNGHQNLALMRYDSETDSIGLLKHKVGEATYDMLFTEGTYYPYLSQSDTLHDIGSIAFAVEDEDNGFVFIAQENCDSLYILKIVDGCVTGFSKASKPSFSSVAAVSRDYAEISLFSPSAKGFVTKVLDDSEYGMPSGDWLETDTVGYVNNAIYTPDGHIVLLSGSDMTVYTMEGHRGIVSSAVSNCSEIACVPDEGPYVYLADGDCTYYSYDVAEGAPRLIDSTLMNCPIVSMTCQGSHVVAVNSDGDVMMFTILRDAVEGL